MVSLKHQYVERVEEEKRRGVGGRAGTAPSGIAPSGTDALAADLLAAVFPLLWLIVVLAVLPSDTSACRSPFLQSSSV